MRTWSSTSPRRSSSVATSCFRGNRGSNRYTRTLVSTRAGTLVQILSLPPPLPSPPDPGAPGLPEALALRRRVEELEPHLAVHARHLAARRHHSDRPPRGPPPR